MSQLPLQTHACIVKYKALVGRESIKVETGGRDLIGCNLISDGGVYGIFLKNGAFSNETLNFFPEAP